MAYGNQGDFQRKMYQGNWKCSKCQTDILELPFEPDPSKSDNLMCRDCFKSGRDSFRGGRSGGRSFGEGKTYQGNWECSKCGSSITELPFEPDPARVGTLLCRDCHRQRKQSFGGGRGGFRR